MSLNRVRSVMIPAFNEEGMLELILKYVLERPEVGEVSAVDAGSRRAIEEVRMPFVFVQDADLEYDPRDYPTLLQPLVEERADVV